MSGDADKGKGKTEEAPDLVRHYRPIAIRSVLAAHAMIPRTPAPAASEPPSGTGFALPSGFHSVPED
ncbi:hypothetical protein [Shinella sp.]|uniref:hypothetical protein n=1 Tax=Shinella sp. TaxID=1870904 RepID=UPI0029AF5829|nr:hypothetical protein [Shinella sp.]MDX3974622.1 hypothetical protein [Shinella sp.]